MMRVVRAEVARGVLFSTAVGIGLSSTASATFAFTSSVALGTRSSLAPMTRARGKPDTGVGRSSCIASASGETRRSMDSGTSLVFAAFELGSADVSKGGRTAPDRVVFGTTSCATPALFHGVPGGERRRQPRTSLNVIALAFRLTRYMPGVEIFEHSIRRISTAHAVSACARVGRARAQVEAPQRHAVAECRKKWAKE